MTIEQSIDTRHAEMAHRRAMVEIGGQFGIVIRAVGRPEAEDDAALLLVTMYDRAVAESDSDAEAIAQGALHTFNYRLPQSAIPHRGEKDD
ncbi:MAG: hypothetical protein WDN66_04420 [Candidatus Saccharibacteria bacterium]